MKASYIIRITLLFCLIAYYQSKQSTSRRLDELQDGQWDNETCGQYVQRKFECEEEYCEETATVFNYISFYYCSGALKGGAFVVLLLAVFIFLRLLGSTADEYFCLSLETLVVKFNISPNLAGVTFLSFGNGAADVFSLIASFASGAPELGLSGLVGACLFTTAVVISLILWVTAVKLHKIMYLRNIAFFIFSVTYLFIIFIIGTIHIYEAAALVVIYAVFVITAIVWNEKEEATDESIVAGDGINKPLLSSDEPIALSTIKKQSSEFDDIYGKRDEEALPKSNSDDNLAGKGESSKFSVTRKVRSISVQAHEAKLRPVKAEMRPLPSHRAKWRHLFTVDAAQYRIRSHTRALLGEEPIVEETKESRTIKDIFIDDLREIKEGKIWIPFQLIEYPFVIGRRLTVPFLDEDLYCKELNLICFIIVPWFAGLMAGIGFKWYFCIGYALLSILGGLFIWFCTEKDKRPTKKWIYIIILCYAFLSCVLWIFKFANELVNGLQTVGRVLDIPQAIMGLTILAFGNSIDDFVADVALAKQGFPAMAMTGCYCSPLFQMLFGLGVGLIIQTAKDGSTNLKTTIGEEAVTMVFLAFIFLLGHLIMSLIITIMNKFTVPRWLAICLMVSYTIFITIIILLTTGVFTFRIHI